MVNQFTTQSAAFVLLIRSLWSVAGFLHLENMVLAETEQEHGKALWLRG